MQEEKKKYNDLKREKNKPYKVDFSQLSFVFQVEEDRFMNEVWLESHNFNILCNSKYVSFNLNSNHFA